MDLNQLDGLIAENIGDLEAAISRARGPIDEKLNEAAWKALKRALKDQNFYFDEGEDPDCSYFAPNSWVVDDDIDPWFELSSRERAGLETWLASYVAPKNDPESIGIQWHQDCLYVRDYKAILEAHTDDLLKIEKAGFRRDGRDIYLPISFDKAVLAEGLRQDDLTEAMEPISKAVEALLETLPAFERIRNSMVAKTST